MIWLWLCQFSDHHNQKYCTSMKEKLKWFCCQIVTQKIDNTVVCQESLIFEHLRNVRKKVLEKFDIESYFFYNAFLMKTIRETRIPSKTLTLTLHWWLIDLSPYFTIDQIFKMFFNKTSKTIFQFMKSMKIDHTFLLFIQWLRKA